MYGNLPSSTFSKISMPALRWSGPPLFTKPRCCAYCTESNIGDQGRGFPSSAAGTASRSKASTPLSRNSMTCAKLAGFKFNSSAKGRGECSMTQRNAEKGSRTCAKGMSMPTIWTSRGTSNRGKTTPGLSHKQVRSSKINVCKVFVCPGVAFTLTNLPPMMLFTREDLPTLGCPTRPRRIRPAATPFPDSAQSADTRESSAGVLVASGASGARAPHALWHSAMRAARPIGKSS
mmetsp:Transcript_69181/g.194002  ORF Transcript_69181/g.194002 Transcript_69181/m.194002 type:complete len:233 (-) Transcript_69181:227-925(-)